VIFLTAYSAFGNDAVFDLPNDVCKLLQQRAVGDTTEVIHPKEFAYKFIFGVI